MKTIAVIPARGGSKRLPGKNILSFGGIPLMAHSIRYALDNSDIIDEVIVSTNDVEIKKIAIQYGAQVVDRPESISGDFEPTVSALQHVLTLVPASRVVLLQPTNPLRPKNLIRDAIEVLNLNGKTDLFTVSRNYQKLGKIENNKFVPYNYALGQRSQDLEPLYFENGLLYISAAATLTKGSVISENAIPYVVDHPFAAVDIDNAADFKFAEWILKTSYE
jgi:CMP-N-acetylneuraminic acid synthetase